MFYIWGQNYFDKCFRTKGRFPLKRFAWIEKFSFVALDLLLTLHVGEKTSFSNKWWYIGWYIFENINADFFVPPFVTFDKGSAVKSLSCNIFHFFSGKREKHFRPEWQLVKTFFTVVINKVWGFFSHNMIFMFFGKRWFLSAMIFQIQKPEFIFLQKIKIYFPIRSRGWKLETVSAEISENCLSSLKINYICKSWK